ncbi:hypothetical protein C0J52_09466 [Blattella germanica]|nr:hypothetical protein C0J52_09466 [Blattella germanica]
MAGSVCSVLGIDKEDVTGKLIAIEESHGSNGNFILSCLMAEQIKKDCGICLVTLHNSFGHYHNVGTKLGYNLQQLEDKGGAETVEVFKLLNSSFSTSENYLLQNTEDIIKNLFLMIKTKIENIFKNKKTVCLVIDDASDLLSLGVAVKDVLCFFQYCRSLFEMFSGLSIIVLTHIAEGDKEQHLVTMGVAHVADIKINISSLKTGQSNDVSGVMKVIHRSWDKSVTKVDWNQQNVYHFKLLDRQVKVFAPGTAPSLV